MAPRCQALAALPLLPFLWLLAACGAEAPQQPRADPPAPVVAEAEPPAPHPERPLVVFLGDSLTAGLGLEEEDAFPARLQELLAAEGLSFRLVNAGVSGDTTAGGLSRLDWLLRQRPDVLVVGLGANDGLRGLDPEATEENLRRILLRAREAGSRVLLLGMRLPPNYGPDYTRGFEAVYPRLAAELEVPLVPFLLAGVGGVAKLNLADGIHPNRLGHQRLAENVAPYLAAILRRLEDEE